MSVETSGRARIGLVTSERLGDSLILATLAENLRLRGYAITVYSEPLATLAPLIPRLEVRPFPREATSERLSQHHLMLYDAYSPLADMFRAGQYVSLEERSICFSLTKGEPDIKADHLRRIRRLHPPALAAELLPFARCNAQLRDHANRGGSMIDHMCYTATLLGASQPTRSNGIHACGRGASRRILIHPTASTRLKEWPAARFVELARALRRAGYEPAFIMAPAEREPWLRRLDGEFEIPLTPSVLDLARCCSQARLLVGNDSGNAHLASALGLPVVLVINRRKPGYRWRPDWSPCRIVYPLVSRRLIGHRWGYCLSVGTVVRAVRELDAGLHRRPDMHTPTVRA